MGAFTSTPISQFNVGDPCVLLTNRMFLMRGEYAGREMRNTVVFYSVNSPEGKSYTCRPENVFTPEEARQIALDKRGEQLPQDGYNVSIQPDGGFRIYNKEKHGADGGYTVREWAAGLYNCTCPYFEEHGDCKHIHGLAGLLHAKVHTLYAAAGRYAEAATEAATAELRSKAARKP